MNRLEFNRYCAEVMGYEIFNDLALTCIYHAGAIYQPATDLNQMAEVFDKLWKQGKYRTHRNRVIFDDVKLLSGIAQAMRQFIESTKEES